MVLLAKVANVDPTAPGDGAVVGIDLVGDDLEQGRLAVTVPADDTDAVALVDADRLVDKHPFAGPFV